MIQKFSLRELKSLANIVYKRLNDIRGKRKTMLYSLAKRMVSKDAAELTKAVERIFGKKLAHELLGDYKGNAKHKITTYLANKKVDTYYMEDEILKQMKDFTWNDVQEYVILASSLVDRSKKGMTMEKYAEQIKRMTFNHFLPPKKK